MKDLHIFLFWFISCTSYILFFSPVVNTYTEVLAPLLSVSALLMFHKICLRPYTNYHHYFSYLLFFSISILSLLGFSETLTGQISHSTSSYFYGLSFYSLSLAYLIFKDHNISPLESFKISNPLLVATGPILISFRSINHKKLSLRIKYFLPFVLVGIFFFQALSVPLTSTFFLIEKTDLISTIVFGIIFELFVYTNFCGLSLILFGLSGIFGYKIPLNFKQPFSSKNLIEFWRGWHVTLSAVLKLLFYDKARKYLPAHFAIFIVFFSSAMWHGVSYNFLLWGIFHSLTFILTMYLLKNNMSIFTSFLMFIGIVMGRIIFAESNIERLLEKFKFQYTDFEAIQILLAQPSAVLLALIMSLGLVFFEFFFKENKMMLKKNYKFLRSPKILLILSLLFILFVSDFGDSFAIYGQR